MGPSSSGGITVIQILKLLEHVDLPSMGPDLLIVASFDTSDAFSI